MGREAISDMSSVAIPGRISVIFMAAIRRLVCAIPVRGRIRVACWIGRLVFGKRYHLLPLRNGRLMVLNTGNKLEIVMYLDLFSQETHEAMQSTLRPGDVFVDCGANVGCFTFPAAEMVSNQGYVLAIDANPYCADRLRQTARLGHYENVQVLNAAAGSSGSGTITLNIADDPMYSSICDVGKLHWTSKKATVEVPVVTLDNVIASALPEPDRNIRLLKLDIEGAEIAALRGAEELLKARKIDYIYVEVHPVQLQLMGLDVQTVQQILESHEYRNISQWSSKTNYLYASPSQCTTSSMNCPGAA